MSNDINPKINIFLFKHIYINQKCHYVLWINDYNILYLLKTIFHICNTTEFGKNMPCDCILIFNGQNFAI